MAFELDRLAALDLPSAWGTDLWNLPDETKAAWGKLRDELIRDNLSVRAAGCIGLLVACQGGTTLRDAYTCVCATSDDMLLRIDNFGKTSLREVRQWSGEAAELRPEEILPLRIETQAQALAAMMGLASYIKSLQEE